MLPLFLLVLLLINNGLQVRVFSTAESFARDDFPSDFVFGSGFSAYQVEGAAFGDGRTPSIWDTYAHAGYASGANGDVACDVYHKYKEDVRLMVETGLEAFRFSISWSRLIPNGSGPINPKGLQFYNNFIDELVTHGIEPHVTLFHSDLPQILEDTYGGWISEKSITDFVSYADVCFREFGDRVLHWTTINEGNIFAIGGYDQGLSPPAHCSPPFGFRDCVRGNSSTEPYVVGHNLLLAHAYAARLYNENYKARQHGDIGINLYAFNMVPLTNSVEDLLATQRSYDFYIGWFMNPITFGDYPDIMKKNAGTRLPAFTQLESRLVKGSSDFVGINYYTSVSIKDKSSELKNKMRDMAQDMAAAIVYDPGDLPPYQYPIKPSSLQEFLEYMKQAYDNPPIYIHENGQATERNGTLDDTPRVKYLHAHLDALLDAIRNGSNTRGYFYWSFLDAFELLYGYNAAFGLYYVDLDDKNLTRYAKLSQHWYSNFLKGKNLGLDTVLGELEKHKSSSFEARLSQ